MFPCFLYPCCLKARYKSKLKSTVVFIILILSPTTVKKALLNYVCSSKGLKATMCVGLVKDVINIQNKCNMKLRLPVLRSDYLIITNVSSTLNKLGGGSPNPFCLCTLIHICNIYKNPNISKRNPVT